MIVEGKKAEGPDSAAASVARLEARAAEKRGTYLGAAVSHEADSMSQTAATSRRTVVDM